MVSTQALFVECIKPNDSGILSTGSQGQKLKTVFPACSCRKILKKANYEPCLVDIFTPGVTQGYEKVLSGKAGGNSCQKPPGAIVRYIELGLCPLSVCSITNLNTIVKINTKGSVCSTMFR